jgi:DNA polymerase-3 subunit beta
MSLTAGQDLLADPLEGESPSPGGDAETATAEVGDLTGDGGELLGEETPLEASHADLKIRTKRFVFQALFEKASSVVPSKDIMPVLKNFQVEALAGRLRVVATDLELSVVTTTEMVQTERTGVAVFPAKKILEIIREAEDEDMVIDVQDGVASITVGPSSWTLRLQNGDDYPPLPEISEIQLHEVDRVKFLGAVNSVRLAAAADTTRPSLMMINVQDGKMTACDGTRIQQALLPGFPLAIQIPIGAVEDLVKLLRTTDLAEVGIGESDYHLVFRIGTDVFIANKLMAQFPDVEVMLLQPALRNSERLLVDRGDLATAVKRVKITADPETSAIVLRLDTNSLTVESKDKFGNAAVERLDASWARSSRLVVVNHKFLTDMLSMYDGKSCLFKLGEDTRSRKSPVMLVDEETGVTGIIQQMRADWVVDE